MGAISGIKEPLTWQAYSERLKRELAATSHPKRRIILLHALARIFSERLSRIGDAFGYLDLAIEAKPGSIDVIWDAWRLSTGRDREQRLNVLLALLPELKHKEDQVSAHLWLAKLFIDYFTDDKRAFDELQQAVSLLPDHRGVILSGAEFAAGSGDLQALEDAFEHLGNRSTDPTIKAILYSECAAWKHGRKGDQEEIAKLISAALEKPGADWSCVKNTIELSRAIGNFKLQRQGLKILAEAALAGDPPTGDLDWPRGHYYTGFERGQAAALAYN